MRVVRTRVLPVPAPASTSRRPLSRSRFEAVIISPSAADDSGSVSEAVARAVRVVRESGLPNETTSMFTSIEGDWDEVMAVVKEATDAVRATSNRVSLVLKADIRPGHEGELEGKITRMEQSLGELDS